MIQVGVSTLPLVQQRAHHRRLSITEDGTSKFGRDVLVGSTSSDFLDDTWSNQLGINNIGLVGTQGAFSTSMTNNLARMQSDATQHRLMNVGPDSGKFDAGQK